jgi:hypothetical protein
MTLTLRGLGTLVTACVWAVGCGSTSPSGPMDSGVTPDGGQVVTSGTPTGLWVDGLYAYSASQLATTGSPAPEDVCPVPADGASSFPAAFDAQGNMWAQQAADQTLSVILWTADQLTQACSSASPARTVTINYPVGQISTMAFDAQGTLWLSFQNDGVLLGLSADQLLANGTVVPAYTVLNGSTFAASLTAPSGMAFDAAGNLWVGNIYSVLEYKPATLAAALSATGGSAITPAPDAYLSTLATENAAMNAPSGVWPSFKYVAFDASGNLWVTGSNLGGATSTDYLAEYTASALLALSPSNTTPAAEVSFPETAEQVANSASFGAIAFDGAGNLWLGAGTQLFGYPAANIAASGSGVPATVISGVPFLTGLSLAFNPIPSGLPIKP